MTRAGSGGPSSMASVDRMLVAQAQVEGLPILTADLQLGAYDVEVLRA